MSFLDTVAMNALERGQEKPSWFFIPIALEHMLKSIQKDVTRNGTIKIIPKL